MSSSISPTHNQKQILKALYLDYVKEMGFLGHMVTWFKTFTLAGKCDIAVAALMNKCKEGSFEALFNTAKEDIQCLQSLFSDKQLQVVDQFYSKLTKKVFDCFDQLVNGYKLSSEEITLCENSINTMGKNDSSRKALRFSLQRKLKTDNIDLFKSSFRNSYSLQNILLLSERRENIVDYEKINMTHQEVQDVLHSVDASSNEIMLTHNDLKIAPDISKFKQLKTLNLSYNDIKQAPNLSENPELHTLRLRDNLNLTGELDLSHNPDLEVLELNKTNIKILDLSNNKYLRVLELGATGIETLPDVKNNKRLQELNLGNNSKLSKIPVDDLLQYFMSLPKSCKMNVANCGFSKEYREEFENKLKNYGVAIHDRVITWGNGGFIDDDPFG